MVILWFCKNVFTFTKYGVKWHYVYSLLSSDFLKISNAYTGIHMRSYVDTCMWIWRGRSGKCGEMWKTVLPPMICDRLRESTWGSEPGEWRWTSVAELNQLWSQHCQIVNKEPLAHLGSVGGVRRSLSCPHHVLWSLGLNMAKGTRGREDQKLRVLPLCGLGSSWPWHLEK